MGRLLPKNYDSTVGSPAFLLYFAHFFVELVLGAVKLKGTYSSVDISCAPGAEKFARHHGVSLIALAIAGGEVLRRGLLNTVTAEVVSFAMAIFHTGTMVVMLHALHLKVVCIHAPFAVGFWVHYLSRKPK
mmetsp:Transcript_1256/g.3535  ORF Transcript_1256/g.3535 Transcript_1256/m.3535 type:complete len:131 (-) Transcript_1256:133-525(-)